MIAGLLATLGLLVLASAPAVLACRMADQAEREEAQRNLVGLIADQARADERVIADNLDL
jgi:hypothetical protein